MKNPTIENPRLLKGRHPCPNCGSETGGAYYEDHFHCYSEDETTFYSDNKGNYRRDKDIEEIDFEEVISGLNSINSLPFRGSKVRGIYNYIYEFYGVRSEIDSNGEPASRYYPWYRGDQLTTYKQKTTDKKFYLHGDTQAMNKKDCQLFGQHLFSSGGRQLVITEGEDDCCAVQQAYDKKYGGKRYPVVSLYNKNVMQPVMNNLNWIMSFDKIILWPDQDKDGGGQQTMENIAKAIGSKAHIVECTKYHDANDALREEDADYVVNQIWNAQPYKPAGFVSGKELWNRFQERKNVKALAYPECLSGLNDKLKGMRVGEIALFVSGTGSGKSTVTKEIMMHIMAQPNSKLGIVSLEEDVGETVQKFIEMQMEAGIGDDENSPSEEEQYKAYQELFESERVIVLDHQGSVGDSSLIDKLRALCAMGCDYIVLDHITIAVSEGNEGLTGNEAVDKMMSDLLKLVKQFPVWLGIISHLRKTASGGKSFEEGHMASLDDIKGSGSIKQVSFDIVAFARNMIAESEEERNTIRFRVLKARFTGLTGDAGYARYVHKRKRLMKGSSSNTDAANEMFKQAAKEKVVDPDEARRRIGL